MIRDVSEKPFLVVSDGHGQIFEIPEYRMVGMCLNTPQLPEASECIPLPYGSDLFELPGRVAIGYDPKKKQFVEVREYRGNPVFPVAAFMAPAYVQFYRAAFRSLPGAPRLPLYCYTAVGWQADQFYVTAMRIDPDVRQDLSFFNLTLIENEAHRLLKAFPKNRLVHHLIENCVFRYGCPAAGNFTLSRWECPLPTSPGCNSACVGCISEQPQEHAVTAPQERIGFVPTPEEIAEIAVAHLEQAPRAVVSFGQGCEGEPLLAAEVIETAIREIRKRTDKGIINLNTNASRPDLVERLCQAGLDSIRVSLNSAQPEYYHKYYRPRNYTFEAIEESLLVVRRFERWASLNYFVFPGFTDSPDEMAALQQLVHKTRLNMIQTRNLNMDPEWYIQTLGLPDAPQGAVGIPRWIAWLRETFPWIKLGYFNPPKEEMLPAHFQPAGE
ncbi:MAG: radical SAM protein [Calditrichaeota bacterium]|nr:radical SAM protein [Calditrichota bacterium]